MENKIHKISVQRLLLDTVSQELKRKNRMRVLAKPGEIIWQQMKIEFFEKFLEEGFHFVRYDQLCENNPGQEREWNKYYPLLPDYSQNNYISCWYNSSQLSNVIFKTYAQNGIAIGIKIEKLTELLPNASDDFYLGNVQYISDEELNLTKSIADYQKIAPVFLKKEHCSADKEFRVCMYKENDIDKKYCKVKCDFGEGWYIAVTNGISNNLDRILKKKGLKCEESTIIVMDGFKVYEVKKMKTSDYKRELSIENFHSINFDSVQQRNALLAKNGYLNYLRLKAILRLQILLSGKLVLSDAQIYDGLFFFWMAECDELNGFLKCSNEANFLKVKVRANKIFPVSMFMRPFICSAIELKELSDCIYDITSNLLSKSDIQKFNKDTIKILEERCIEDDNDSPEKYLEKVETIINSIYHNMYADEWDTYKNRLSEVYKSIKANQEIVESWDKDNIIMETEDCKDILEKLNELITVEDNKCYCNHIFSNMIKRIESKHCKRSEFVEQCGQLSVKCKDNSVALNLIKRLLKTFDLYYNQSIARNIGCGTIYSIETLDSVICEELKIQQELLWNLANLSWNDFKELYEQLDKQGDHNLKNRLTFISNYPFKKISNRKLIPEIGPWNYKKTFKYTDIYVNYGDMSFINADGEDSKEMYIWHSTTLDSYEMKFKLIIE